MISPRPWIVVKNEFGFSVVSRGAGKQVLIARHHELSERVRKDMNFITIAVNTHEILAKTLLRFIATCQVCSQDDYKCERCHDAEIALAHHQLEKTLNPTKEAA